MREKALGVVEGIPRDYNNFAPRVGFAWSPWGNDKTSFVADYGLFYDHPLLAIAFNSVTADGGRSVQLLSAGGQPPLAVCLPGHAFLHPRSAGVDSPANLNGSSIFQGVLNADSTYPAVPTSLPSVICRINSVSIHFAANSLFANQNYLTAGFPLPIFLSLCRSRANFKFGYARAGQSDHRA